MANYVYTESATLQTILQDKLPILTMDDPTFEMFPTNEADVAEVMWEQRDNYSGLLTAREYDGGFGRVQREGLKLYKVQPGKYGDQKLMNEEFLTVSRNIGTFGTAIDIRKEQQQDQEHLLSRAIDRIRKIVWDLLGTGTYSVPGPNGSIIATDNFPLQTFVAGTSWSNHAASTPLADMRSMKLKQRGHSVRFDRSAKLFVNQAWVNHALSNTNTNDLGGRRVVNAGGQIQPLTLGTLNQIFMDEDLPSLVGFDDGYYSDPTITNGIPVAGAFNLFIPDATGILIGQRMTGEPVGQFTFTRNANNLVNGRGSTEMYINFALKKDPVRAITSLGFNGAPELWFPSAIVQATL